MESMAIRPHDAASAIGGFDGCDHRRAGGNAFQVERTPRAHDGARQFRDSPFIRTQEIENLVHFRRQQSQPSCSAAVDHQGRDRQILSVAGRQYEQPLGAVKPRGPCARVRKIRHRIAIRRQPFPAGGNAVEFGQRADRLHLAVQTNIHRAPGDRQIHLRQCRHYRRPPRSWSYIPTMLRIMLCAEKRSSTTRRASRPICRAPSGSPSSAMIRLAAAW